jgi:adenylate cyclase
MNAMPYATGFPCIPIKGRKGLDLLGLAVSVLETRSQAVQENERRLAAIMFTDMVDYTALTQKNETAALELLEYHRRRLRPLLSKHSGREIKTIGDAFLVEFSSALEAARCAFEIQEMFHEYNVSSPLDRTIRLRIGIHVGDVIHSQNDVYGDAVNIASRIEPVAEPEGICITDQVYDQIRNKFEFPIVKVSGVALKNVSTPVEIYKIILPWEKQVSTQEESGLCRLAVLPLTNISQDSSDEYFADGLTEELISTISKIGRLCIISRTSVMRFKNTTKSIEEISRDLKVGTLLEGSVRKANNRVRISVQLIDAKNDQHLWSESYDRELKDIFEIQADIAQSVAHALELKLLSEEKEEVEKRGTADIEAFTFYLQGRKYWNERSKSSLEKAIDSFMRAIEKDPNYALAYVGIANCYVVSLDYGYMKPSEAAVKIKEYAKRALELDPTLSEAHAALASAFSQMWKWKDAEREFKTSLELNPNYSTAHQWYAIHLMSLDKNDMAIEELTKALRLDPLSLIINTDLGIAHFRAHEYEKAIEQLNKTLKIEPKFPVAHSWLGTIYAETSRLPEAIKEFEIASQFEKGHLWANCYTAAAMALSGDTSKAKEELEELLRVSKSEYAAPTCFAVIYSAIGETDLAIEWLGKVYDEKMNMMVDTLESVFFKNVKSDPRYMAILEKAKKEQRLKNQ